MSGRKYPVYLGSIHVNEDDMKYWKELARKNEVRLVPRPNQYVTDVFAPKDTKIVGWATPAAISR